MYTCNCSYVAIVSFLFFWLVASIKVAIVNQSINPCNIISSTVLLLCIFCHTVQSHRILAQKASQSSCSPNPNFTVNCCPKKQNESQHEPRYLWRNLVTSMHCSGMHWKLVARLIFEWHVTPVYIPAIMSHSSQLDHSKFSTILRSLFLALMTWLRDLCDTNIYLNIHLKMIIRH